MIFGGHCLLMTNIVELLERARDPWKVSSLWICHFIHICSLQWHDSSLPWIQYPQQKAHLPLLSVLNWLIADPPLLLPFHWTPVPPQLMVSDRCLPWWNHRMYHYNRTFMRISRGSISYPHSWQQETCTNKTRNETWTQQVGTCVCNLAMASLYYLYITRVQ